MTDEHVRAYRQGDKVYVRWQKSRQWISGRVIVGRTEHARVAVSAPSAMAVNWGTRWIPVGTPLYMDVPNKNVHFIAADPAWNPCAVEPFLAPDEYRFLGGDPKRPHPEARRSSQLGAYMPATYYAPKDPVWVWESSWHRAEVTSVSRSWIRVRLESYRDSKGNASKGFRPPWVWPVVNDFPAPMTHIFADPTITLVETRPGFYDATPNPAA